LRYPNHRSNWQIEVATLTTNYNIKNPSLQGHGEIKEILVAIAGDQDAWEEDTIATHIQVSKFMRARVEKMGDNAMA